MENKNKLEAAKDDQLEHFKSTRQRLDSLLDTIEDEMRSGTVNGLSGFGEREKAVYSYAQDLSESLLETINIGDSLTALKELDVSFKRLSLVPEEMLEQRGVYLRFRQAKKKYAVIQSMVQGDEVNEIEVIARIDELSILFDMIFTALKDHDPATAQQRINKEAVQISVRKSLRKGFSEQD